MNTAMKRSPKGELQTYLDEINFFIPSEGWTESWIKRLVELDSRTSYESDSEKIQLQREHLGQQIYLYLTSLSMTPEALNGNVMDLKKEFNSWFRRSVGLTSEALDKNISFRLVIEFAKWLKDRKKVVVKWGEIISVSKTEIIIRRLSALSNS